MSRPSRLPPPRPAAALPLAAVLLLAGLPGCGSGDPPARGGTIEATSLLGEPLRRPELPPEALAQLQADLAVARARADAAPEDEESIIWLGRRLAYLGRYGEAIEAFRAGLALHPESHKLLRHRGHRYLTLRRLDEAAADLERAARLIEGLPDEIEPDGAPNRYHIPRSTSHSNIWYHLGLARYVAGDFEAAAGAYRAGAPFAAANDDMTVANSYWLYLSLRRLGRDGEAAAVLEPIGERMEILESHAYHDLLRLFQGARTPDDLLRGVEPGGVQFATLAYGAGAWHLLEGRADRAAELFRRIVEAPGWAAFGHLAAEAELARGGAGAPAAAAQSRRISR